MNIIGEVWHPGLLEDAAEAALRAWFASGLEAAQAQDEAAPAKLAPPRSYNVMSDEDDRWPDQQLPAIIIESPGMVETPDRAQGDGSWHATWALSVSAICRGRTEREARRVAQLYWAAICLAMLQRRSLGDDRYAVTLVDSALTTVEGEKRRTLAGATALFHVEVTDMFCDLAGPLGPDVPDPMPETWPAVTETNIETEIQ